MIDLSLLEKRGVSSEGITVTPRSDALVVDCKALAQASLLYKERKHFFGAVFAIITFNGRHYSSTRETDQEVYIGLIRFVLEQRWREDNQS